MYREGTIVGSWPETVDGSGTTTNFPDDFGPEWQSVVGNRVLKNLVAVDFGLGEECIALLAFHADDQDVEDTYEVGIGEALRGYSRHYHGTSVVDATRVFLTHVDEHTFGPTLETMLEENGISLWVADGKWTAWTREDRTIKSAGGDSPREAVLALLMK